MLDHQGRLKSLVSLTNALGDPGSVHMLQLGDISMMVLEKICEVVRGHCLHCAISNGDGGSL